MSTSATHRDDERNDGSKADLREITKDTSDHFRNLGICASVAVVGSALMQNPEWLGWPDQDAARVLGALEIVIAVVLAGLNSVRFLRSVHSTFDGLRSSISDMRRGRQYGGAWFWEVAVIVTYGAVVASIIVVGANLQLSKIDAR
jgi:hypothetical protein